VDFETNLTRFDVQRLHHSAVFSKAGTGLSSHEVNQPGSYRDVTDTTVVAQFKVLEESLSDLQRIFRNRTFLKILFLSMDHYTVDFTK
jgi:predicted RNA-binding protein